MEKDEVDQDKVKREDDRITRKIAEKLEEEDKAKEEERNRKQKGERDERGEDKKKRIRIAEGKSEEEPPNSGGAASSASEEEKGKKRKVDSEEDEEKKRPREEGDERMLKALMQRNATRGSHAGKGKEDDAGKGKGEEAVGADVLDLCVGWDFRRKSERQRALRIIKEDKPKLIVGGSVRDERNQRNKCHTRFLASIYQDQMDCERWF